MTPHRTRRATAALLLAVLAAGCADSGGAAELPALPTAEPPSSDPPNPPSTDEDSEPPAAAATATEADEPTADPTSEPEEPTETEPEPSQEEEYPVESVPVDPPAAGPDGEYTEAEYRAIYTEHQDRSSQFATTPDFDLDDLGLFFTEECQCWDDFYQYLVDERETGEYTIGPPPVVVGFDLLRVEDDGSFVARVIDQQQATTQRFAADGTLLEEYPPGAPFESEVRVTPTPDGWRTTQLVYITEVPAEQPS